jgi:ATP-dependent Clp protease ATP-binding subunit ClpA
LTALARRGSLAPFVDRQALLGQFLKCLADSPAERIALCGPRGVGKCSLVAALAQTIARGAAPAALDDCRVIEVSVAEITGLGRFWADGLERLKQILANCDEKTIVFIRDAAELLAAKDFLRDPAAKACAGRIVAALPAGDLAQRALAATGVLNGFERFDVPPATPVETREILTARCRDLERRYGLTIQDDVPAAAAGLASNASLPGSAVDLLEKACKIAAAETRKKIGEKELEIASSS